MGTPDTAGPQDGTYTFAVTCYRRQPGDRGGWSSMASAEMHEYDAADWIAQRAAECKADGLHAVQTAAQLRAAAAGAERQAETAAAAADSPAAVETPAGPPL